jgi:hypothetical protein
MNFNSKSSLSILFTIALFSGFLSLAYIQTAHAFSIDFSGLPGFGGNGGLDFLKGPKGDTGPAGAKGDIRATGPQGEQGLKGDKGDTGAQGEQGQRVEFGHLIVIVHMDDTFTNGQVQSSDFTVHISGNQQSPDSFPGSETGTDVKIRFGSYQVTEDTPNNPNLQGGHIRATFSKDCSSVIHPDEEKTCTITNIVR